MRGARCAGNGTRSKMFRTAILQEIEMEEMPWQEMHHNWDDMCDDCQQDQEVICGKLATRISLCEHMIRARLGTTSCAGSGTRRTTPRITYQEPWLEMYGNWADIVRRGVNRTRR